MPRKGENGDLHGMVNFFAMLRCMLLCCSRMGDGAPWLGILLLLLNLCTQKHVSISWLVSWWAVLKQRTPYNLARVTIPWHMNEHNLHLISILCYVALMYENVFCRRTTGPIRRAKGGWTLDEVSAKDNISAKTWNCVFF